MSAETWIKASADDLPERFTDPRCAEFRYICSNGFESDITLSAAFLHKPHRWPQCFPNGADGDCSCTLAIVRRVAPPESHPTMRIALDE